MDYRSSLAKLGGDLRGKLIDYRSILQTYKPIVAPRAVMMGAGAVLTFMLFPDNFLSTAKTAFADSLIQFGSTIFPDRDVYQGWDCMSVSLNGAPEHEYTVELTDQFGSNSRGRNVTTDENGVFEEFDMFCFDPNNDQAGEYTLKSSSGRLASEWKVFYNDGEF